MTCDDLVNLYASIRSGLFTGFITAGSFIFSMQTFTVSTLKTEVYDKKWYKDHVASLRLTFPDITLYGNLLELKNRLFWCMLYCYITSIIQITLGFIPCYIISLLCLMSALLCIYMVIRCAMFVSENINCMLEIKEAMNRAEEKAAQLAAVKP